MPCPRDPSRTDITGGAYSGSQRQIQAYVNERTSELGDAVVEVRRGKLWGGAGEELNKVPTLLIVHGGPAPGRRKSAKCRNPKSRSSHFR